MKALLVVCLALILVSCGKYILVSNNANQEVVVLSNNMYAHKIVEGGKPSPSKKFLIKDKKYDRFKSNVVYFEELQGFFYYKVNIDNEDCFVTSPYAMSSDDWDMVMMKDEFEVPNNIADEAWGRALKFVMKHSTMKIQSQSDLMIDTYNPIKPNAIGFTINRVKGSENNLYEVKCSIKPNPPLDDETKTMYKEMLYRKRLAYYVLTGKGIEGERKDMLFYLQYGLTMNKD